MIKNFISKNPIFKMFSLKYPSDIQMDTSTKKLDTKIYTVQERSLG